MIAVKFQNAFEILGKKWNGLVLWSLIEDPKRFTDIRRNIPELSDRVLTERLRELESLDLIKRNVYARIPVKVEYELTQKGKALEKSMLEIQIWAENNLKRGDYFLSFLFNFIIEKIGSL